jgi:L-iditol 2-dehydrogenase
VGLGATVHAVARGARVIAIEPNEYRARLALRLGAVTSVDPDDPAFSQIIRELTDGCGASCAIETSGVLSTPAQLLSALWPLGRMALLAWDAQVRLPPLVPHGAAIHGCWHWNHLRDLAVMWTVIRKHGQALDAMVTHEFGFDSVAQAMDLQDTGRCGKVLLYH